MFKELKEILKKEAEQSGDTKRARFIERATTLSQLNYTRDYTFTEAVKKLKEAGIPIVLTEEEKEARLAQIKKDEKTAEKFREEFGIEIEHLGHKLETNQKDFKSASDIVMVHKTDYAPKNGKIDSRSSGGVLSDCTITLGGKEYHFACKSGRDTVHFSANHEVGSHMSGNWDARRYAVIIPFEDLKEHSTIVSARSVDTYTRGAVHLTENSYILCPKGESATIQEENPNVTVIEYEGEAVQDYANMLISELGYKVEIGNDHGFQNTKQNAKYGHIMEEEGIHNIQRHANSEDKESEKNLNDIYYSIGVIKLIRDEQLVEKIGRENLIDELNSQEFFTLLHRGFEGPYYDEFVEELKGLGINVSLDGLDAAFKAHIDETGYLDSSEQSIEIGYVLDAISERNKATITSTDLAELDKSQDITTQEINSTGKLVENLREPKDNKTK